MEEWKRITLKEATDIIGDGLHGTPVFDASGEYFFVNGNNLVNGVIDVKSDTKKTTVAEFEKYKKNLTARTLFVSINGTIGNIARYRGERIVLGKSACYLNVKPEYDLDYIYYILCSEDFQNCIKGLATGTTIKNVSLKTIREYSFYIPSLERQRHIGHFLRSIDDKIALNNCIKHNLEELAQAIFKSWFVDFDPFQNESFIDSELGLIPKGWNVIPLEEIISYYKKTLNPQKHPDTIFTHYSLPAFDNSKEPETQKGSEIMSNKIIVENKMILFSKLNPRIKRLWFIDNVPADSICSTEFIAYKAKEAVMYPFCWCYLNGREFYDNVLAVVNGATGSHQRFHAEETLKYLIPFNKDVVISFSNLVSPILQSILNNESENKALKKTRDTLLPKLMSGEIAV